MLRSGADASREAGRRPPPSSGPGSPLSHAEATLGRIDHFGVAAATWAALETGVLRALLEGPPRTAARLAADLDLALDPLERILELLATTDLVRREERSAGRDIRYAPDVLLAALRDHGRPFAQMELTVWRRLPDLLHRHGAVPELSTAERAEAYAEIAEDLVRIAEPAARRLAAELGPLGGRVLDVGCGGGVWSLALARANPGLRITGLDLPDVVPHFLERARTLGLADRAEAVAGDMGSVELEPGAWDLAIVANVLHLEPDHRARRVVRKVGRAVNGGGALLIIDAFPGSNARSRRLHAAYRLHLGLRCPHGDTPDPDHIQQWLRAEGFTRTEPIDLGAEGPLRGILGRR